MGPGRACLEGAELVVGARAEDDHAEVGREVDLAQGGEELGEEVGEAAHLAQPRAHQHHRHARPRQRPCAQGD